MCLTCEGAYLILLREGKLRLKLRRQGKAGVIEPVRDQVIQEGTEGHKKKKKRGRVYYVENKDMELMCERNYHSFLPVNMRSY